MPRTPFNDDWTFRAKASAFSELGGAPGTTWAPVTLPHDALVSTKRRADVKNGAATGYFDGGVFEYRKVFPVAAAQAGDLVVLEFDGVYRDAMIYVNGVLAGQRASGYSRFTVRIDPLLRFGDHNEIRVECRAHDDARWYSGAGIYRDVHLISKTPVHIAVDGVRVTTVDADQEQAVIEVAALVENLGATTTTVSLDAAVLDLLQSDPGRWAHTPVTLRPGETARARLRLYLDNPRLWSVEDPQLHTVAVELRRDDMLLDREQVVTGIRTLQLDPLRGLRINTVPVKLRGACVHHDNGPLGAAAIERAEERRVELLKAAGFNALRSAHNPMSSAMLAACDRIGMLVMDEAFDMWTSSKVDHDYAFAFPGWWERDIEAMITKDVNHPSVIMYSIGNEIPETGTPLGANLGRQLAETVRRLDPTRYVTNGINGFVSTLDDILAGMNDQRADGPNGGGVNTMMAQLGALMRQISTSESVTTRTEESFAVLDIAGMNYGDGRYELDRELFPDRIIVGTETFPTQIAENWALVSANPQILGDFTWTGWDYLGEAGLGGIDYAEPGTDPTAVSVARAFPWLTAWCGDIDIIGHRRPISYYREIVFGLRNTPYIAVHRPENYARPVAFETPWSWSDAIASWSWPGFEGRPVKVEVYSDADEIELVLDDRVVGRSTVGTRLPFVADFNLVYQPGTLIARAITDSRPGQQSQLVSARPDRVLTIVPDTTRLHSGPGDLAFLQIAITDPDGIVHTDATETIHVDVNGPGVLQGLGSGNPKATGAFTGSACSTFDGRLLAVIRPTGTGPITVTVSSDTLPSVTVTLTATVDNPDPALSAALTPDDELDDLLDPSTAPV